MLADIVRASERTGKLCQIGHQHRSSAVYRYIRDWLFQRNQVCGGIHNIKSQSNKSLQLSMPLMWHRRLNIESAVLRRYGYDDMNEFMNWRHFRKFSQGDVLMRTSRFADLVQWLFEVAPSSVLVSSHRDFFKDRDNHDNLMCILEYDAPQGKIRAFHQSLSTVNEPEIRFEKFLGDAATVEVSRGGWSAEIIQNSSGVHNHEKWRRLLDQGILRRKSGHSRMAYEYYEDEDPYYHYAFPSMEPDIYELPGTAARPVLEAHLANFFDSVHGRTTLNGDARTVFEAEAAVYWLNAAAESGGAHRYTPDQLAV